MFVTHVRRDVETPGHRPTVLGYREFVGELMRHGLTHTLPPFGRGRATVAHETVKALCWRKGLLVSGSCDLVSRVGHAGSDGAREACLIEVVSHRSYALELLAQRGQVVLNVLMSPEVGDGEAARTPCLDHIQRGAPCLQIDIRRRRGSQYAPVPDPNSGDIAGEGHPGQLVQVGDVMGGMAWRIGHPEGSKNLAAAEHPEPLDRHGEHLAPEALDVLAIQARGASKQLGGIGYMRGTALVYPNLGSREALDQ